MLKRKPQKRKHPAGGTSAGKKPTKPRAATETDSLVPGDALKGRPTGYSFTGASRREMAKKERPFSEKPEPDVQEGSQDDGETFFEKMPTLSPAPASDPRGKSPIQTGPSPPLRKPVTSGGPVGGNRPLVVYDFRGEEGTWPSDESQGRGRGAGGTPSVPLEGWDEGEEPTTRRIASGKRQTTVPRKKRTLSFPAGSSLRDMRVGEEKTSSGFPPRVQLSPAQNGSSTSFQMVSHADVLTDSWGDLQGGAPRDPGNSRVGVPFVKFPK